MGSQKVSRREKFYPDLRGGGGGVSRQEKFYPVFGGGVQKVSDPNFSIL